MADDYQIAALWMEGNLSFMEELCLKSFVDAGHHTILYHYGEVTNVPGGVEMRDASVVLPRTDFLAHERTGSPALHSDLFRYKMLEQMDRTIWADTDAYCMKPFRTDTGHFYGYEDEERAQVNGGVLGLPRDCDTLGQLLEFTTDEFAIPPWLPEVDRRQQEQARDAGTPVHVSEQRWGVWGPLAVTHFLKETGEIKYALPERALYPVHFRDRRQMLSTRADAWSHIADDTASVHFYGRRMRAMLRKKGGVPPTGCMVHDLAEKHGIDPQKNPVPVPVAPVPLAASEKYGRGIPNLTDLADRYGSDKGSAKHCYTELYQMLFSPFRTADIDFLEMGLLIGGPELGFDRDRETRDLPSVRMWLEYFENARIHGLDISDFSWFDHERFTFHCCDMETRENIRAAAKAMPEGFDIIIDDASHASHHQQNAFIEMFPKVKPGGLYIIEDLRWQPAPYERKGIKKTAALFQDYLQTGVFEHEDARVAEAFNAARIDISGCFMHQVRYQKQRRDQVCVIHKR